MDFTALLPWVSFIGMSTLIWLIFTQLSGNNNRANQRLDELRDPSLRGRSNGLGEEEATGVGGMFRKAAPKLSKALEPKTELEQNELKVSLANAGFRSPAAPQIYLALRVALLIIGGMMGTGVGLTIWGFSQNGYTSIAVGGGLGFYLPQLALMLMIRSRKDKIFLSMPDALDLLVVCVEAGLGLDAGMRRVAEELEDSAPEVSSEFSMANMQLQMGRPRREVLHDLGVRTGVDDMRALAAILIQADRFGSSIAQALRVQSDSMRVKRRQLAEERAQKTAVQMIFPLVLFIFPGIFVVLVGPAAIMMINGLLTQ